MIPELREFLTRERASLGTAPEHVAARPGSDHPHAKVVIVRDGGAYAMTVVPMTGELDLAKLQRVTRRWGLALASDEEFRRLFPGYEIGSVPPFGRLFGLPVYLDRLLAAEAEMVFESGARREECSLPMGEYVRIERPGITPLA